MLVYRIPLYASLAERVAIKNSVCINDYGPLLLLMFSARVYHINGNECRRYLSRLSNRKLGYELDKGVYIITWKNKFTSAQMR